MPSRNGRVKPGLVFPYVMTIYIRKTEHVLTWVEGKAKMSIEQQLLIEQRVSNEAKSPLVTYLLAIFLWGFGAYRMYLGHWASGIIMLVIWGIGWLTTPILIGWLPVALVCVWAFIDLFLIPGMIKDDNAKNRQRLTAENALGL